MHVLGSPYRSAQLGMSRRNIDWSSRSTVDNIHAPQLPRQIAFPETRDVLSRKCAGTEKLLQGDRRERRVVGEEDSVLVCRFGVVDVSARMDDNVSPPA